MNLGSYTNAQKLIQFQCQKIGLTFRFKMRVFYNRKQFNNNGFFVFPNASRSRIYVKMHHFWSASCRTFKNTFLMISKNGFSTFRILPD